MRFVFIDFPLRVANTLVVHTVLSQTLTAEAISEILHRPLYSVSLGQLGTAPTELEAKLGEVLELCSTWDALVLIDEADILRKAS